MGLVDPLTVVAVPTSKRMSEPLRKTPGGELGSEVFTQGSGRGFAGLAGCDSHDFGWSQELIWFARAAVDETVTQPGLPAARGWNGGVRPAGKIMPIRRIILSQSGPVG